MMASILASAFHKLINGSFSIIDLNRALRISVSGAERIAFFLSVFLEYLITMV